MVRLSVFATLACAALASAKVASRKLGVTKFEWEAQQPEQQALQQRRLQQKRDVTASGAATPQAYNFSMPIDHFHNESKYAPHSDGFFNVTYYFDSSYYKPGGPVILLCTGEDSAIDRVPFLQTGILHQLAKSSNGIGVILEHRYYGNSFPVPDLSTPNMRFLSTEQALADAAYFAQHIKFPGVSQDVTSNSTPWFAYGGSYAGAFVAFLRTLYPGVFWGSLSSSGVTAAIVDYWQYFNPIQEFGPQQCMDVAKKLVAMGDNIFLHNGAYNTTLRKAFNLNNVTSNQDVTTVLMTPTNYWQAREWNPAVNDDTFLLWCGNLTSSKLLYPDQAGKADTARTLLKAGGYGDQLDQLTTPLLNWFGYVQTTAVDTCQGTQDSCFALNNPADWSGTALSDWGTRCWTYQVCTQWGYFVSGNGRPKGDLGIISRLQTIPYLSEQCQLSFGQNFQKLPDTSQINSWGNFDIKYPRLFFIGGQADPWRDATPLETSRWDVKKTGRGKTSHNQPAYLIETPNYGAVHHWDEYGVPEQQYTKDFPPPEVQEVQALEAKLVARWVRDWNFCKKNRHGRHC